MDKLSKAYELLLQHFGHQGWWPVIPSCGAQAFPVYGVRTRTEKQRLEIILGAILTQNTQWKPNVERAIIELNKKGLIDIDNLIKVKHTQLAKAIRSTGYFNQKAKKLKNMASFLKKYPIKALQKMELLKVREILLGVNGIGPETADSILLYALNKPIFVVDAYTKRIFSRLGFSAKSYNEWQRLFMEHTDKAIFNEYHALIVELGKKYCRKNPICSDCPLRNICSANIIML